MALSARGSALFRPRTALPVLVAAAALLSHPDPVASQWPMGQGNYWAKVTLFRQSTDERFNGAADTEAFNRFGGRSETTAVFFDATVGLTDYLDLWVEVPWLDLSFADDVSPERGESGLGDLRTYLRYSFGHHLLGGVPLSVRFGAKAPLKDFPLDPDAIPLGEGQWDIELWLEGGASLYPLPAYAVGWFGHRWRLENADAGRDPGDELTFLLDFGLTTSPVGAKVVVNGTFGGDPELDPGRSPRAGSVARGENLKREILQIQPELLVHLSDALTLELGFSQPIHGRNYPAGRQYVVALFLESR